MIYSKKLEPLNIIHTYRKLGNYFERFETWNVNKNNLSAGEIVNVSYFIGKNIYALAKIRSFQYF